MKKIELSKGAFTIVDDEDFEILLSISSAWWLTTSGYAICNYHGLRLRMHRFLNETPAGFDTDHINGNKLDNRKSNLRTATRSENSLNGNPGRKHYVYDLPRGITFDKQRQKHLIKNPKKRFATLAEAIAFKGGL